MSATETRFTWWRNPQCWSTPSNGGLLEWKWAADTLFRAICIAAQTQDLHNCVKHFRVNKRYAKRLLLEIYLFSTVRTIALHVLPLLITENTTLLQKLYSLGRSDNPRNISELHETAHVMRVSLAWRWISAISLRRCFPTTSAGWGLWRHKAEELRGLRLLEQMRKVQWRRGTVAFRLPAGEADILSCQQSNLDVQARCCCRNWCSSNTRIAISSLSSLLLETPLWMNKTEKIHLVLLVGLFHGIKRRVLKNGGTIGYAVSIELVRLRPISYKSLTNSILAILLALRK